MSKTKELLLECKVKAGITTDYQLAKKLEMHSALISDYMNGKRKPDEYACLRIAMLLGHDPCYVIASIKAETEKNAKRREFWRDFLQRVQQGSRLLTLAVIFIASSFIDREPEAGTLSSSHNVYYVKLILPPCLSFCPPWCLGK